MRIIGGQFRGKKILPVLSEHTRPTADRTREMVFNILSHNPALGPQTIVDKRVLDVCAGTGAMGLEALSRGAKSATFAENNPESLKILKKNVEGFGADVIAQDARHLGQAPHPFDLIFLDPPYGQDLVSPILSRLFSEGWLTPQAVVVIEVEKKESVTLPPFLSVLTERSSGRAKLIFARVQEF